MFSLYLKDIFKIFKYKINYKNNEKKYILKINKIFV